MSRVRISEKQPKVYLNLLLTETLSKLISKRNGGDITTGMSYDEMLIVNKLTKPESDVDYRCKLLTTHAENEFTPKRTNYGHLV